MIKAIETTYKGYRFRSRLEARWAVFFDALGLKWEYEPEGFELGGGVRYLPDFRLPAMNCWVEIKGERPDETALSKPRTLALRGDCAVVVYWGPPRVDWPGDTGVLYGWNDKGFTEALACGVICDAEKGLAFDANTRGPVWADAALSKQVPIPARDNKISEDLFDRTKTAISAAFGARFEFGEQGVSA